MKKFYSFTLSIMLLTTIFNAAAMKDDENTNQNQGSSDSDDLFTMARKFRAVVGAYRKNMYPQSINELSAEQELHLLADHWCDETYPEQNDGRRYYCALYLKCNLSNDVSACSNKWKQKIDEYLED